MGRVHGTGCGKECGGDLKDGTAATLAPLTRGGMVARRASAPSHQHAAHCLDRSSGSSDSLSGCLSRASAQQLGVLAPATVRPSPGPASQLRVPGGPESWSTGLCTALAVGHSCHCQQAARPRCQSTSASLSLYCWRITHELAKLAAGWCGLQTETHRHKSSQSSRRCGEDTRKLQGCAHRRSSPLSGGSWAGMLSQCCNMPLVQGPPRSRLNLEDRSNGLEGGANAAQVVLALGKHLQERGGEGEAG